MSRLYLVLLIAFFTSFFSTSQTELRDYIRFADEQYEKGDYVYALEYYEKAMTYDSTSVDIVWKYAQAQRAYKDYKKAEYYYGKVYKKEDTKLYPKSLLYYGLMQKQNGKYAEALETFKLAKKKYRKERKGYNYLKSKYEIQSCLWAKNAIKDTSDLIVTQLPPSVNTENSEFAHTVIDGKLIYSSLRADSISASEEVFSAEYKTHLYASQITDSIYEEGERIKDVFWKKLSSGNGTLSLDGRRFYFSLCEDDAYNYNCKIMVADYKNGKWTGIDSLGQIINEPGANTTMPHIAEIDGKEVLYFSSDREDGKGGMDIWFSYIKNGNQYKKPKNMRVANSLDNDLSPFYDAKNKRFYFSSSWFNGFGGYDVHYSEYTTRFESPKNAGIPINSPANEVYYFISENGDSSYVSSNRLGVMYAKNPTCCSDIFRFNPPIIIEEPTEEETLADLMKRLPVTLYFHNDIPNPRNWDTTTTVNYIDSYTEYTAMLPKYQKEYSKGLDKEKSEEAQEDIESFFIEYVDQGVRDLYQFRDLLLSELEKGRKIQLTVKGFASPLAKTDYNVNLTKRRIMSLRNYLYNYENGVFAPYFDNTATSGGLVTIVQVPFGEYTANQLTSDNPNDVKNSIYSRAAAIERKIEVLSVEMIEDKDSLLSPLTANLQVQDLGAIEPNTTIERKFTVTNSSNKVLNIDKIEVPCHCNSAIIGDTILQPGQSTEVTMSFDSSGYSGLAVKSIYLHHDGSKEPLRLIMTGEVKKE